ncbi:MAG TPA: hypothetical protein VJI15_01985 [Candidatus Nanoarchaeia archaeon]|nr:hypothetical protein [Candidatus Nanoarchaeia archaeon]
MIQNYSVMTVREALGIVQTGLHAARQAGPLEIDVTLPDGKQQLLTYQYGHGQQVSEFIADLAARMADQKRVSLEVRCPSADYHASVDYRQGDAESVLSARAWGIPLSPDDQQQMRGNVR